MSNMYNHRQMMQNAQPSTRFNELLDNLKSEFDHVYQDVSSMKSQKEDYEQRLNNQIAEMTAFHKSLLDLERTHQNIKQQYEEEIYRLRRDIESRGGIPAPPGPFMPTGNLANQSGVGIPTVSIIKTRPQQGPQQGIQNPPPNQPPHLNQPPIPGSTLPSQPQPGDMMVNSHGHMMLPPGPANYTGSQSGVIPPSSQSNQPNPLPHPNKQIPPPARPPHRNPDINTPPTHMQNQIPGNRTVANIPPSNSRRANPHPAQPANSATHGAKSGLIGHSQLSELDPDSVSSQMKIVGSDWFAIFNQNTQRMLNIDLLHSFDHGSVVCCVKFSNDGTMLATGCNHTTQIYDVESGQKISVLVDDSVPGIDDLYIRAVCFSPDDKYLITGAEDNQIRIWDVKNKVIKHTLSGHDQDIYSLDFSPDGKTIVSGSGDKTVRLWDLETGKNLYTFSIDDMGPKDAGVTSVAFSPDGRLVAAASLDKMIRLWDAHTGQFLERVEGHKDSVYAVSFSPDGRYLLSGSLDKSLKIWELLSRPGPNGRPMGRSICTRTLHGHKDFVLSVAYSPDGNWIISGSKDRCVQFWDQRNAQVQCILQGHKNSIISVSLSRKKHIFATGSGDCRARIWSYEPYQH
ncbi:hypothetical protein BB560_003553 [Smittium megazygosporum]|uniref:Transcriptional repressor Tup1 N-terminal domain-containing protein n=1 Tax=Smittium megazygosporum TaxID=133381 RepID=A0A2T9ZBP5_9FUNG|nr:hypothetical protein BB560_003553 [Smittium megazygosporum]